MRNGVLAYFFFGLYNNCAYVLMLSAAKDILEPHSQDVPANATCIDDRSEAKCSRVSTGAILLADIIPALVIKLVAPFIFFNIAYNVRMIAVVVLQAASLIIVASSTSIFGGIFGVAITSLGSGLGDATLLGLSAHYSSNVITAWSSGTGFSGIAGAGAYALMTDENLLALSPRFALLCMLIVPAFFFLTFFKLLRVPQTVYSAKLWNPRTYRIPASSIEYAHSDASLASDDPAERLLRDVAAEDSYAAAADAGDGYEDISAPDKLDLIKQLLRYMIPLTLVYFGEYFINYGLLELIIFDCANGFSLSPASQYRYYQLIYQIGVFLSRTSIGLCVLNARFIPPLAALQLLNVLIFANEAMRRFIMHIGLVFCLILYEGTLGGLGYANTFYAIHRRYTRAQREFSMSFVAISDAVGIVAAGLLAIPAHNFICSNYF